MSAVTRIDCGVQTEPVVSEKTPVFRQLISSRKEGAGLGRKDVKARVISLPESFSNATERTKTPRVVSMTERPKPSNINSPTATPLASALDSFEISNNSYTTVSAAFSTASSEIPHTPSPPSSPDSVLVIVEDTRLSHDFMRRTEHESRSKQTSYNSNAHREDGWLTWSGSPPRPIPALHGPLSLPYARCPSGAEGTVIEPTENASHLVWGLGESSTVAASENHRSDSSADTAATKASFDAKIESSASRLSTTAPPRIDLQPPSSAHYLYQSLQMNRPLPPSIDREIRMAAERMPSHRDIGRVTQAALQQQKALRGAHTFNPNAGNVEIGRRDVYGNYFQGSVHEERRALEEEKIRFLEARHQFEEEQRDAQILERRRFEQSVHYRSLQQQALDQDRIERRAVEGQHLGSRALEEQSREQHIREAQTLERMLRARGASIVGNWTREAITGGVSNHGHTVDDVARDEHAERDAEHRWQPVYTHHSGAERGSYALPLVSQDFRGLKTHSRSSPQHSQQPSPSGPPMTYNTHSQHSSTPPKNTAGRIHSHYQQTHHSLPTPPNATREDWVAYHPSGREAMPTPELSPPVFAPSEERVDLRRIATSDTAQQLRQYAQDPTGHSTYGSSSSNLGAAAQIHPSSSIRPTSLNASIHATSRPIRAPLGPPPTSPLPSGSSSNPKHRLTPGSLPASPNALSHPPRSVPFARMLQRKLAPVLEEEGNLSTTEIAPVPSKTHSNQPTIKISTPPSLPAVLAPSTTSSIPLRPLTIRTLPPSSLTSRSQPEESLAETTSSKDAAKVRVPIKPGKENTVRAEADKENPETIKPPRRRHRGGRKVKAALAAAAAAAAAAALNGGAPDQAE